MRRQRAALAAAWGLNTTPQAAAQGRPAVIPPPPAAAVLPPPDPAFNAPIFEHIVLRRWIAATRSHLYMR